MLIVGLHRYKKLYPYRYDFLKGNDNKVSKRISTIQNGIWNNKSCLIEEFDKMLEIFEDYKIRTSNV
jgi:hypothetical protein